MNDLKNRLTASISAKLGRCGKCMRLSLALSLLAWAGVLVAMQFGIPVVTIVLVAFAVPLTALWISHVIMFGNRVRALQTPAAGHAEDVSRMRALRVFGRGAALGVLVSMAFVVRVRAARDQCGCNEGFTSCPGTPSCCRPAFPWYCGSSDCTTSVLDNSQRCHAAPSDEALATLRNCCGMTLVYCNGAC